MGNIPVSSGIEKAWEVLSKLHPAQVCSGASVSFDGGAFRLNSLGLEFLISPVEKTITGISHEAEDISKRLGYFFHHSALWYLSGAKDIGFTERIVRPSDVKGGHHFFKGTHELPLEGLAEKYGADNAGFVNKGLMLGGKALSIGDASMVLYPFPRIPVTLVLWLKDEEFPPKVDLFFDSTCELHIPLDIIWSTAMFTVLAMTL